MDEDRTITRIEERLAKNAAELEHFQTELERTRSKLEHAEAERDDKLREHKELAIKIAKSEAESELLAGEIASLRNMVAATEERTHTERLKFTDYYFEIAKQTTTLNTASLLIVLAFQNELSITPW